MSRTQLARTQVQALIESRKTWLLQNVPEHIRKDDVYHSFKNALSENPDLWTCTARSLLESARTAAGYGFRMHGQYAEAYIIPYKDKRRGKEAKLQIGYRGAIELVRRTGQMIGAPEYGVVRAGDTFSVRRGDDAKIIHDDLIAPDSDKREITHVYVIVRLKDGVVRDVWTKGKIDKHMRDFSPGWKKADSIWQRHWERAAFKTIIKSLVSSGRLPISESHREIVTSDEQQVVEDGTETDWIVETDDVVETVVEPEEPPVEQDEDLSPAELDEPTEKDVQKFDEKGLPA